ncbi:hypothetical protein BDZ45DRAFT_750869 [Acephala macrosclerotiorum]|nr:hypothetical protein BDZ45DRAFT_750869 [Acephala macrosclerotiorum]
MTGDLLKDPVGDDWFELGKFIQEAEGIWQDWPAVVQLKKCLKLMKDVATNWKEGGTKEQKEYATSILSVMIDAARAEAKHYTNVLLTECSFNKCNFRSREGYAGLGTCGMKVDDVIVIFFDADVPYVLGRLRTGAPRSFMGGVSSKTPPIGDSQNKNPAYISPWAGAKRGPIPNGFFLEQPSPWTSGGMFKILGHKVQNMLK